MKVPPSAASLGVTVTVPVIVPFAPTVKLVDATPVVPLLGPLRVGGGGSSSRYSEQLLRFP